jgi:hypothetical protein
MLTSLYQIDFERTFVFDVTPNDLWDKLEHLAARNDFDGWLFHYTLDGQPLQTGSALNAEITPPLPYRIRLTIEFVECNRPSDITMIFHGDVEGTGSVRLLPSDESTHVTAAWKVEMKGRPMRTAARVAYPVVRWGHDRVVDATVWAFRRQLRS